MSRRRNHYPTLYLSSLITFLQISRASPLPFGAVDPATHDARTPKHLPNLPLAIPYVSSSSVYEYIAPRHSTSRTKDGWQPIVCLHGDGHVQTACTRPPKPRLEPTRRSTIVSSSIETNYYTPQPRQDTTSWTSTSTATVYKSDHVSSSALEQNSAITPTTVPAIAASTTSNSPTDFTAPVPDASLTSLTTSEVQTVTEAPETNTSGVSQCSQSTVPNARSVDTLIPRV